MLNVDVAIVGAGIAGAGLAAELAGDVRVALLERESRPGYHSTGRSAAIFIQNYGNATIRALSRASRPLFADAGPGSFPNPLLSHRGMLTIADEAALPHLQGLLRESDGLQKVTPAEALAMVPLIRPERLLAAAYEPDAQDIDVAALHQGWLRQAKSRGARLLVDAELLRARREAGSWLIDTKAGPVAASVIVNAAGAWADGVAEAAGLRGLGIQPMRRTIAVLPAPPGHDVSRWPLVDDAAERWYMKPETGRLLVSPSDEDPMPAHDVFPDDLVLAEGLDRFEQAMAVPITRVETRWAGLRSFAPDRTPVVGFDPEADGFFWLAGQGGYGIQTSPALSRLAGALVRRVAVPQEFEAVASALSPVRLREQPFRMENRT